MKITTKLNFALVPLLLCLVSAAQGNEQERRGLQALSQQSSQLQALYPAGSIANEAQAEQAISQTQQVRQALQAWAQQAETECYERFFVYACLQEVRQTRRLHSDKLQAILLDAKATQRRLQLQQRDQELQEKNQKQ